MNIFYTVFWASVKLVYRNSVSLSPHELNALAVWMNTRHEIMNELYKSDEWKTFTFAEEITLLPLQTDREVAK